MRRSRLPGARPRFSINDKGVAMLEAIGALNEGWPGLEIGQTFGLARYRKSA